MEPRSSDLLASEAWSGLTGSPLVFVDPNDGAGPGPGVWIAIDRTGTLPKLDPGLLKQFLDFLAELDLLGDEPGSALETER